MDLPVPVAWDLPPSASRLPRDSVRCHHERDQKTALRELVVVDNGWDPLVELGGWPDLREVREHGLLEWSESVVEFEVSL